MKKSLVLASLLALGSINAVAEDMSLEELSQEAESSIAAMRYYVGADFGYALNDTDSTDYSGIYSRSNSYTNFSFKFGAGRDGGWKNQIRFSMISYDNAVARGVDKSLTEFGWDFMREFRVNEQLFPYVKFGVGYGWSDETGYTDTLAEVSYLIGGGVSFKAMDNLYVVGGIDYVGRSWQDTTVATTSDSGFEPYVGVNYAF